MVLNEAFHPAARDAFVNALATNGPYKHYVSLLRGHAPKEGLTLKEVIALKYGKQLGPLETVLENSPEFLDYEAVPRTAGSCCSRNFRCCRCRARPS